MRRIFWTMGAATAALCLSLNAQLQVRGLMIQQLQSKPGQVVKSEFIIENTSDIMRGGSLRIKAVANDRDLSSWIEISDPYFNIPGHSAVRIKYTIRVPENVTGSYWTKYILTPTALKKSGLLKIRFQLAGFIILDMPGGKTGLIFEDIKHENDSFFVDVKNSGTVVLRPQISLYAGGKPYVSSARFCFPGELTRWILPAPDLPSGRYQIIVIAQGKKASFGTRWDADLGVEMIKEIVLFVPIRFQLSTDIGPGGHLRSVAATSASIGRWRMGAGAIVGHGTRRANFNLGYSTRRLQLDGYSYIGKGSWRTAFSATLNLKRWWLALRSSPFQETGNFELRYQFNRGYLGARATVLPGRFDWNLTASIPVNFQLKFKQKIKRKRAILDTIIFTN